MPPKSSQEDGLARNYSISCELDIWYPFLQAILSGRKLHHSLMVRALETRWNSKTEMIVYYIVSNIVYNVVYNIVYNTLLYYIVYNIACDILY